MEICGENTSQKPTSKISINLLQRKKKKGLKKVIFWVRPEDVESLKEIALQPHTIAKLKREIETELNRTLEPDIKSSVKAELSRRYKNIMTKEIKDAWHKEKRLQEKQNTPTPETSDQIEKTELLNIQKDLF